MSTATAHPMIVRGRTVAAYVWQPALPISVSPRPYFHPVTTLGGVTVTQLLPPEHPHHLGVSVALPDAGGANFWGGRTFRRDVGPIWLANHGTQRHVAWLHRGPEGFEQSLCWYAADGSTVFSERRRTRALPLDGQDAWALEIMFELTNERTEPVSIRSPATNGRPGAGYGGFFWRVPRTAESIDVHTAEWTSEEAIHGTTTRWLAVNGMADGRPWGLVFVHDSTGTGDRWFVRTRENPGVGLSLAWDKPLSVPAGGIVRRMVCTVVADGRVEPGRSAALAQAAAGVSDGAAR